jgi:hypothetical protein
VLTTGLALARAFLPLRYFLLCSTFGILASMDVVFCLACACCSSAAAAAPRVRDAVQRVVYGKTRSFAPAPGFVRRRTASPAGGRRRRGSPTAFACSLAQPVQPHAGAAQAARLEA